MNKPDKKRSKSKIFAALLAFLLPGAGNMYTGQRAKGLLLLLAFFIDIGSIIRLANSDGGRHLLLIVYLAMLLPVVYFISVYSALQSAELDERTEDRIGAGYGAVLILAGLLLLVILQPPSLIMPWLNEAAELSTGMFMIAGSCILLALLWKGVIVTYRVGRLSAALLIAAVGGLLLSDKLQERNDIALLALWWPMIIIAVGLECIGYSMRLSKDKKRLRIDLAGLLAATLISGAAFAVTQYGDYPARWLDQFNTDLSHISQYDEEKGYHYDKPLLKVPVDDALELISISNANGHITVRTGEVLEAEIAATIWVDVASETEAQAIAEQSFVQISPGRELYMEAKGQSYGAGGAQKARMNMVITLPESLAYRIAGTEDGLDGLLETPINEPIKEHAEEEANEAEQSGAEVDPQEQDDDSITPAGQPGTNTGEEVDGAADPASAEQYPAGAEAANEAVPDEEDAGEAEPLVALKIDVGLGDVDVSGLHLPGGLDIRSGSGIVKAAQISGPLTVKSNNGTIEAKEIYGPGSLEAKYGSIAVSDLFGDLYVSTLNGSLELTDVNGNIEAETKNGKVAIEEPKASVKADTLNGDIELISSVVAGDWDLGSSIGEIKIRMPEIGDYRLYGSVTFGKIETELPFDVSKKIVKALSGAGTYRIQINANNSIVIARHGS